MPAQRLACIAIAAAATLLAGPLPVRGDANCAPAMHLPAPPVPVRGFGVDGGFELRWQDLVNSAATVGVDGYFVFRAPLDEMLPGELIGSVDDLAYSFLDAGAGPGDFVYWVKAHNCQGFSAVSNLVSTRVCADWEFESNAIPPLEKAWAQTGCTAGSYCYVLVVLNDIPNMVSKEGCNLVP